VQVREIHDFRFLILSVCVMLFVELVILLDSGFLQQHFFLENKGLASLSSEIQIVDATSIDRNTGNSSDNNWLTINHDLYGTRSTNQTIINKDNVDSLRINWQIVNDVEIQDPPIIDDGLGYVQDYAEMFSHLIRKTDKFFGMCE
jgi:alcohol dehydrogenase (cytochrome c)